jgi:transposase
VIFCGTVIGLKRSLAMGRTAVFLPKRWLVGVLNAPASRFERASRPESAQGFVPVAKRWVVERSIAWTNFFRRIVKDYEYMLSSSVGWLLLANIQIMLQRIKPVPQI